mmetsp:Transcript_40083/g.105439  ORF Transcript_40083/g.105439 Transcript_40083/m.105439 type:complete len:378 (-) Transcript_40083:677-1810(-)
MADNAVEDESVVTPEQLNQMTETELVARAAAALTAADDASAARRPAAAPFVTLALALRVYNHVQSLVNAGTCSMSALVALALVVLDLTGARPPDNYGETEKIGTRFYDALFNDRQGHLGHRARHRLITGRGNPPATKARQRKDQDETLLAWPWGVWPAAGTQAVVPPTATRVERGGAGPRGDAAWRLLQDERREAVQQQQDAASRASRAERRRDDATAVAAALRASEKEATREAAREAKKRQAAEKAGEAAVAKAVRVEQRLEKERQQCRQATTEKKELAGALARCGSQLVKAEVERADRADRADRAALARLRLGRPRRDVEGEGRGQRRADRAPDGPPQGRAARGEHAAAARRDPQRAADAILPGQVAQAARHADG